MRSGAEAILRPFNARASPPTNVERPGRNSSPGPISPHVLQSRDGEVVARLRIEPHRRHASGPFALIRHPQDVATAKALARFLLGSQESGGGAAALRRPESISTPTRRSLRLLPSPTAIARVAWRYKGAGGRRTFMIRVGKQLP